MSLTLLLISLIACVTPQRVKQSEARTKLGTAYLREGSLPDAVLSLREAVKQNPLNPVAWERLALAYMGSEALEESEIAFKKAIRLATADVGRVHYNYGLLLLKMERYESAIIEMEITLSDLTYRTPSTALNSLGFVYLQMEKHDLAVEKFTDALRRSPKMCQPRFHRALTFQRMGQHDRALEDFDAVISTCGNEVPGAYFHAAEVLLITGDKNSACDFLRTARKTAPNTELDRAAKNLMSRECGP
jgi:Tfp pilus assembly protein PilF